MIRVAYLCTAEMVLLLPMGCGVCTIPRERRTDIPPDLDAARDMLRNSQDELPSAVVAECTEANLLLTFRFTSSFTWQYDYFDADTGLWLARKNDQRGEVIPFMLPCGVRVYPRRVRCGGAVVTEVLAGSRYSIGDTDLPFP